MIKKQVYVIILLTVLNIFSGQNLKSDDLPLMKGLYMNSASKKVLVLLTVLILSFSFLLPGFAAGEEKTLMSVSYRGDTASYPENSLEAILSAVKLGADMVSVSVQKTSDGVYVLAEDEAMANFCGAPYGKVSEISYEELREYNLYDNSGKVTGCKIATLEEAIKKAEDTLLILDSHWQEKDGIYDLLLSENALSRVYLRTKESAKNVKKWVESKEEKVGVIAVYDGNIVFNETSHFNTVSKLGMPFVQYQSKNYFNVMYGEFVYKRFFYENAPKVIAPMYDADLCGQRGDSEGYWSELIDKGFSVIETNNISSLVSYIDSTEKEKEELSSLIAKAEKIDLSPYSGVCKENLNAALTRAKETVSTISSEDRVQQSRSALILAMNELNIKEGEDSQKGALNITAGKIIAAVAVGLFILAGEVYVHKMQKEKKR